MTGIISGAVNVKAETEADRKLRIIEQVMDLEGALYLVTNGETKETKVLSFSKAVAQFYDWQHSKPSIRKAGKAGFTLFGNSR